MMREMKDSGVPWIGEIPSSWRISRVKEGFIRKKQEAHMEDPVILSLARAGVRVRDMSKNEGQIAESYYNYNTVSVGDLLLNPMDLYSGANCSVSHVEGVISPAYVNLGAQKGFDSTYYDYYFKTQYWAMALFAHGKGVSFDNRWTLSNIDLMRYFIPVPPSNEQQRIAGFLDSECARIDSIIDQTRASIEEYKKLKQAVITQAVTKGIRPNRKMKDSSIEWIGEIPEDWDICKLRHIGSTQNGISKSGDYFGEGYPFVSYGDVYRNISLPQEVKGLVKSSAEEQELYSVKTGDIFFTRTSETIEEVGFSSVCEHTIPNATFAGFLIRVRPYDDTLDIGYSKYYFRSNHHRHYLVKQMNLVTRASLGQPLLKGMYVLVPSKEEQREIAAYLDKKCAEMDRMVQTKEVLISELESYKKSLIYEYVTGKKEVSQ